MPLRGNKHGERAEQRVYPGFDGGLNLASPSESIAPNELKEAVNFEFSSATGALRTRGGLVWSGRFDGTVKEAVPAPQGFLVRIGQKLWRFRWNCVWPVEGTLSGEGPMSAATWGEGLLVASGGKLQLFTEDTMPPVLSTLEDSPLGCRLVFVRSGRVGVVTPNDDNDEIDTIRFSRVGDCERWDSDPTDDSTGQFLEVGYKDGMDITAVVPLSKDLIVFKNPAGEPDKGTVWRLTGDLPDSFNALEAAHNTGTFSQRSVQAVGNDVYYLTPQGLAALSSVTAYGEVKAAWPDRKVANVLSRGLREGAQLWNVPVKQQLWALPSKENTLIWVFDYGRGIWTQFEFPERPVHAAGVGNGLYVFIGRDLYQVNDWYAWDELYGKRPKGVRARARMGALLKGGQTLIKRTFATFSTTPDSGAELKIGGFVMPLRVGGTPNYIYGNTTVIYGDDEYIIPAGSVSRATRRGLVRDWALTPDVTAGAGCFELSTMGFEVVEV